MTTENIKAVTFDTSDGVVKIDTAVFQGYLREAFEYHDTINEAKESLKLIIETVAENTGMKKSKVAKYFKERYEAKTKATKELGELFGKLDEVVAS